MISAVTPLARTTRELELPPVAGPNGAAVVLRRHYDAPVDKVWEACVSPDHLKAWFAPVSGELALGGSFQFEGNAGGEVLECDAPRLLRVSWRYGDSPPQEVSVRLHSQAGGVVLALCHRDVHADTAAIDLPFAVGPGWDLSLLILDGLLQGRSPDMSLWESPEGIELIKISARAWQALLVSRGLASHETIKAAGDACIAFYTGIEDPARID